MALSCLGTLSPNHTLLSSQTKHTLLYTLLLVQPLLGYLSLQQGTRWASALNSKSRKYGYCQRNPPDSKLTQLGVRQWPNLQSTKQEPWEKLRISFFNAALSIFQKLVAKDFFDNLKDNYKTILNGHNVPNVYNLELAMLWCHPENVEHNKVKGTKA